MSFDHLDLKKRKAMLKEERSNHILDFLRVNHSSTIPSEKKTKFKLTLHFHFKLKTNAHKEFKELGPTASDFFQTLKKSTFVSRKCKRTNIH